ncbi:hypothetical protein BpHYR1_031179 [Brachionus plicatilis]|uniref:Uncharacterized protein n=1 Tax=Brachionus plicatilis TaxID=10195 RepID=A0A3M7PG03_BRAPC|nr:hypothetical protein BpHYR1_031179 [Brachionus plicatilis]
MEIELKDAKFLGVNFDYNVKFFLFLATYSLKKNTIYKEKDRKKMGEKKWLSLKGGMRNAENGIPQAKFR